MLGKIRSFVGTTVSLALITLLIYTTSSGSAESDSLGVKVDGVLSSLNNKTLQYLPLNPTIIKNESGFELINVFVKQTSFGQYTLAVSPTVSWRLSPSQEMGLKKLGGTTYAAWPGASVTPYLYYEGEDSDVKSSAFSSSAVVIGANSVMTLETAPVELQEVKDLLFGKKSLGVAFAYEVATPIRIDKAMRAGWVESLETDIQTYGALPADGLVARLYADLADKYSVDYNVPLEQVAQLISRLIRSAPVKLESVEGAPRLVVDLSVKQSLQLPSVVQNATFLRDMYQGQLDLRDLCSRVSTTVFFTNDSGTSVGCSAIKDK